MLFKVSIINGFIVWGSGVWKFYKLNVFVKIRETSRGFKKNTSKEKKSSNRELPPV